MTRPVVWGLLAIAVAGGLFGFPAVAQEGGKNPAEELGPTTTRAGVPEGDGGAASATEEESNEVRITIRTEPEVRAEVRWGRKLLGKTPLDFMRPRDSGPMDLVLTRPGYLTVRTRAYTFERDKIFVRMTRIEDKHMIFGYKRPLPPPPPDSGVADVGAADGGPSTDGGQPPIGGGRDPTGGTQSPIGGGGVPTGGTQSPIGGTRSAPIAQDGGGGD